MDQFTGTIQVPDTSAAGGLRFNGSGANVALGGPSITFDLGEGTFTLRVVDVTGAGE